MAVLLVPRSPWPPDFPPVVVHARQAERDVHPDFRAAKSGDKDAAIRLARHLGPGTGRGWKALGDYHQNTIVLPVSAVETEGFNAIPDAFAHICAHALGLPVRPGEVIQINRVGHTRARGWHRLVTPALFSGPIQAGRDYLLVDDHVGFGGTLANLRGYVEANGARVVALSTLTETRDAHLIAPRPETLSVLRSRHGEVLENLWRDTFGHGLDCLTDIEAGYLARQLSVDAIRARMAEAAEQARRRGLPAVNLN